VRGTVTQPAHFSLWTTPSPTAAPAPHRWIRADVNGDGRQDLLLITYRNPGYEIYVQTASADGRFALSHLPVLPASAAGAPLDIPDTGAWRAADVGGPEGGPDGRTDLVLLGRSGTTLAVTTLLSTGSGWSALYDPTVWQVAGSVAAYPGVDLHAWRLADLNGDDAADLFHVAAQSPGVRLEYLLSQGDGRWTSGSTDAFTTAAPEAGPLTRPDANTFRTADLNRDGFTDFVHVETGGSGSATTLTIRSLLSTGPAAWEEEVRHYDRPVDSSMRAHLRPLDFNADGVPDLGRAVVSSGCVQVEAYVRVGTEWSALRTGRASPPCDSAAGLEDSANLVIADVNDDGRTDAYRVARTGSGAAARTVVSTLLQSSKPDAPWRWVDQPNLPGDVPDSWAWLGFDRDADGAGDLVHVGADGLATLRWQAGSDRLGSIHNGRGASTTVTYRTQAGARAYLPPGMLPVVVDSIESRDTAHDPPVQAVARFVYDGARWSSRYHHLIGYESIRSEQGQRVVVVGHDLTDACGARRDSVSVQNPAGGVLSRTDTTFAGTGQAAPYQCLVQQEVVAQCEATTSCLATTSKYEYDGYGNATAVTESGPGLVRREEQPVRHNTADYIVDRPYANLLMVPGPGASWRTEAKTLFGYDDGTWEDPPKAHGDLTQVNAFTDIAAGTSTKTVTAYDEVGNVERQTDPVGTVTKTYYDTDRQLFPVKVCTPVGCSGTEWNERFGVVHAATDWNGKTTVTDHDAFGRRTTITLPDGGTSSLRYLDFGRVTGPDSGRQRIRIEVSDGSPGDGVLWSEELFDGLGRTYRTLAEGSTASPTDVIVSDVTYNDASGRAAAISLPRLLKDEARHTTFRYDALHRMVSTFAPGATSARTRSFRVGESDETDELGHTVTRVHDAFGRISRVDEHVRACDTCALKTLSTTYGYDASDALVTITDAMDNVTTILRDALGRQETITDPDRGTTTTVWRDDGTPDTLRDANGTTVWTYDAAGRQKTRTAKGQASTQTATWDYDRDPVTNQTQGASIGLPVLVQYATTGGNAAVEGSHRFWYDAMGRRKLERDCVDTVCHDMGFTYDAAGRPEDLRYPNPGQPDDELVSYRYDPAGRLRSVGSYLTGIEHDAAGNLTSQIYGNGTVETRSYDPNRQWLDSQSLTRGTTALFTATYTHYDDARVRNIITTNPTSAFSAPVTQSFAYDELGRLITATSSDRSNAPQTYTYDAIGRFTSSPAASSYTYADPAHVHAITGTSAGHERVYNDAGQITRLSDPSGRSLKNISWTPGGMPQSMATGSGLTTMAYDEQGQRVKRTINGRTTYFFGRYLDSEDGALTRYYWAGDQLIAQRNGGGSVLSVLQDRSHSTRVVSDSGATVTARYNYEPFGAQKPGSGDATALLWQGSRSDPDSGLAYMNARFFDPELSQFTAPDTIIPDSYRPQSLNPYSYGENDPVNTWDPSGHMPLDVELKKEQEHAGLLFSAMYAGALAYECLYGGYCSTNLAPNIIQYRECVNCGDPSEWAQYPGETSAPPLLEADEPCCTDPSEWNEWQGELSPPPLVDATPLDKAPTRPAPGKGMVAEAPRSAHLVDETLTLNLTAFENHPTTTRIPEAKANWSDLGGPIKQLAGWLGLVKTSAAYGPGIVGAAVGEIPLLFIRVPDAFGANLAPGLPPWVEVKVYPGGFPDVTFRGGLPGAVHRALKPTLSHEWHTAIGDGH